MRYTDRTRKISVPFIAVVPAFRCSSPLLDSSRRFRKPRRRGTLQRFDLGRGNQGRRKHRAAGAWMESVHQSPFHQPPAGPLVLLERPLVGILDQLREPARLPHVLRLKFTPQDIDTGPQLNLLVLAVNQPDQLARRFLFSLSQESAAARACGPAARAGNARAGSGRRPFDA